MPAPELNEKKRLLAAAVEEYRAAARKFTAAARDLASLSERDRASLLADAMDDVRAVQTQIGADVGTMLTSRDALEGESVYDRIRREVKESNDAKVAHGERVQKLGEGLI
jgi:hypothetical protein